MFFKTYKNVLCFTINTINSYRFWVVFGSCCAFMDNSRYRATMSTLRIENLYADTNYTASRGFRDGLKPPGSSSSYTRPWNDKSYCSYIDHGRILVERIIPKWFVREEDANGIRAYGNNNNYNRSSDTRVRVFRELGNVVAALDGAV